MIKKVLIGVGIVAVGTAACVGYISYKKYVARKAFVGAISDAIKSKEPVSVDDLCAKFDTDFDDEEDLPVEDFFAEKEEEKVDKAP